MGSIMSTMASRWKPAPSRAMETGNGVAHQQADGRGDEGQLEGAGEDHREVSDAGKIVQGEAASGGRKGIDHHHHEWGDDHKDGHPDHIGDGKQGDAYSASSPASSPCLLGVIGGVADLVILLRVGGVVSKHAGVLALFHHVEAVWIDLDADAGTLGTGRWSESAT